jgi:branched-chain amino acid transport system substrate-binding protein
MAADFGGGYEIIGGFAAAFKKAGGKIIQEIYPPLGTQDYAPYLANISKDADVVSVFFGGADAVRFVQQYNEYGLKKRIPLIGRGGITDNIILPKQGKAALGIVSAIHWDSEVNTAQNRRFIQAYEIKHKRAVTRYAEQGYVGARMMAEAINAAKGVVDGGAFLTAMGKVSFDAPRGPFRLDELRGPVQNIYLLEVAQDGSKLTHKVIKTYPSVSQFWKWSPKEYMAETPYQKMKGNWVSK